MSRIKVSGYIQPADLPGAWRDDSDPTGLTARGHELLASWDFGPDAGWLVGQLDELTVEVER